MVEKPLRPKHARPIRPENYYLTEEIKAARSRFILPRRKFGGNPNPASGGKTKHKVTLPKIRGSSDG